MPQDSDTDNRGLQPSAELDSEIKELVAQLGLSADDAATAWDAVLDELDALDEAAAAAGEVATDAMAAERFDAGALIDLLSSGKTPDLTEMAKDELVKAVAKKLGVDPEKAGPIVDMILKMLDKPTTQRRRKGPAKKAPKKPTAKGKRPASGSSSSRPKKPATASSAKKRPKAKPSSASAASTGTKPAAKKKRPATKPANSADAKPAPKKRPATKPAPKKRPAAADAKPAPKKRPATKPKPAASPSTSKPRKRSATRADAEVPGADQ